MDQVGEEPIGAGGRVLVYTSALLPRSLTFVMDQATGLQRWDVSMVGRRIEPDGIDTAALRALDNQTPASPFSELIQRTTRRVPVLQQAAREASPDLIHAHFLTAGFDVQRTLRPLPCPVVVTAHGFDATWKLREGALPKPGLVLHAHLRRRLLRAPVRFIAVSRYIAERLEQLGAPPDHVILHYTGVDTERLEPPPADRRRSGILFVGRLVEKKGIFDLLRAVKALQEDGRTDRVTVIGDGPERRAAEQLARSLDVPADFLGVLPHTDVIEHMRSCAVLCAPSKTARNGDAEGFGMVLAEAQATGTPVVATRCGGMVEAVEHGRTGLLVAEGAPSEVATALGRLLSNDPLARFMGSAGTRFVRERFDLRKQNRQLEGIYDQVKQLG